jgi:hypothetical protein
MQYWLGLSGFVKERLPDPGGGEMP